MSEQAVFDSLKYSIETDASGTRRYYNSAGQLHRLEGPAVVYAGGAMCWYQNGRLHRIDGPAVVIYGVHAEWCLYGRRLSEEEFNRAITQYE